MDKRDKLYRLLFGLNLTKDSEFFTNDGIQDFPFESGSIRSRVNMKAAKIDKSVSLIINEVQLILAEKRTSLALLRTGIAVFALPLSVLSFLIATSKYYDVIQVIGFLIPLILINMALLILGSYLIIRAIMSIHRYDQLIKDLKSKHSVLSDFID